MLKKLLCAAVLVAYSMEAVAQERMIVTSAPSAQEYVNLLFAPARPVAEPKIRTRGIQLLEPTPVSAPAPTPAPVEPPAPTRVSAPTPEAAPAPQPAPAPQAAPPPPAPAAAKILAAPVRFDSNSAAIPTSFQEYLLNLAEAMKRPEAAGKVVIVSGHTDARGNDAANMVLSARRAHSVELFLIRQGVSPTQVVSTGRGETQLIAGHETEDALNRRVEFSVAAF